MTKITKIAFVFLLLLDVGLAEKILVPEQYQGPSGIQDAIDYANSGDTVSVWLMNVEPDTYDYIDFRGKSITVVNRSYIEDIPGYPPSPDYICIDGYGVNTVVSIVAGNGLAVLQGFTIQNGQGKNQDDGGGITLYNWRGSYPNIATIVENKIINNRTPASGGGILCQNSKGVISENLITGNQAGFGRFGGGIYLGTNEIPMTYLVTDNSIISNNASGGGGGVAIFSSADDPSMNDQQLGYFKNNVIKNNSDGGMFIIGAVMVIRENVIDSNNPYGIWVEYSSTAPDMGTVKDPGFNELLNNSQYDIWFNNWLGTLNAVGNYWGSLHTSYIRQRIYIQYPLASVNFDPIAASDRVASLTYNSECETDVIVTGDLTVNSGVNLTIVPGKTFEFETTADTNTGYSANLCELIVDGELLADGTEEQKINFNSFGTVHSPGDWYGIVINDNGIANFDYCIIRSAYSGIDARELSNLTVDHSVIEWNQVFGINAYRANKVKIFRSDVNSNIYGIRCDQCTQSGQDITEIRGNTLVTNGRYGIMVLNTDYARIETNHIIGLTAHSLDSTIYGICIAWTGINVHLYKNRIEWCKPLGCGIYSIGTNSRLYADTLVDNYGAIGVLFTDGSVSSVKRCWFNNNKWGVQCEYNSFPSLGQVDEIPNPGLNSFLLDISYFIYNRNSSTTPIMAQGNWWGSDPPDPNRFIGPVDYRYWLSAPPPPPPDDSSEGGGQSANSNIKPSRSFALFAPKPNPAKEEVRIAYSIPNRCRAELVISDASGRIITKTTEEKEPGRYEYLWQGKDQRGKKVSNGIYIVRLTAGNNLQTQKITLMK